MGYRAVLSDSNTYIDYLDKGGGASFEEARAEALAYLHERLARRRDHSPARLANLRLALLRISHAVPPPAAGDSPGS